MKLFVNGRKEVFPKLENSLSVDDKTIWIHTASLGEFEQGLPVLEALKLQYPSYKYVVTFFSPSGFEVKKNSTVADVITYLPLDTKKNAKRFIKTVNPALAIFVKYEFWPNYLQELKKAHIPTLLVSGIFRKDQVFFKWYGNFMREKLSAFDHFFLQNETSGNLLNSISLKNYTVCGDTRFNRVLQILERDNSLTFMKDFKDDALLIVIGSSWPEDEEILIPFINATKENVKFIIAPHKIESSKIESLRNQLQSKTCLYSNKNTPQQLKEAKVLIIDTIGLLTKIYSYADIAYVGGGMGNTGLHNTLEPAVFGIPVVIGKNYQKFEEAKQLVSLGGIISVSNKEELAKHMQHLLIDEFKRKQIGAINDTFLKSNANALETVTKYISENIPV
ncbi:3-deoxy-D-manno-octulosonic acid transferase [Pustulibacterium marinum]|nr:glycosyltransferase N-terminal domain-containing protein [Pustulibacterium marinum]